MYFIFEFLVQLIVSHDRNDSCDDFVDRLNRKYTVVVILACVTILTSKQYIGEPLACFCPAHFTGAHVEYTNNICWISRSFFVPIESVAENDNINKKYSNQLNFRLNDDFRFHNTSQMKFLRIENIITYYPFFLLIQAILFYFPFFCWNNIIKKSVYDISTLISLAFDSQKCQNQIEREIFLKYLVKHLDRTNEYYTKCNFSNSKLDPRHLNYRNPSNKYRNGNKLTIFERISSFLFFNPLKKKNNNYCNTQNNFDQSSFFSKNNRLGLFGFYLFIKILYILNCFGQFLILNIFISGETKSKEYHQDNHRSDITYTSNSNIMNGFLFGFKTITNLIDDGRLLSEQNRLIMFHTVVFCDFKIRMLGDRIHRHTVQCVVPVNIFTEKIFTILWFWFFILTLLNVYSLIKWSTFYFSNKIKFNFIKRHLMRSNQSLLNGSSIKQNKIKTALYTFLFCSDITGNNFEIDIIEHMTNNFLLTDNIFIIKLISKNTSEITTRELVTFLVDNFKKKCYILCDENTV